MKLRPYQKTAYDNTIAMFESKKSLLTVAATGTGKTIYLSHVSGAFAERGRVMVVAHREELIYQAAEKISAITGIEPDIEMAENWATDGYFKKQIVVATIQTLVKRLDRHDPNEYSLLVIDECITQPHRLTAR